MGVLMMEAYESGLPLLTKKLIEVDATPDLSKHKPVVILKKEEFAKLLTNLDDMKEPWIAIKFDDTIFVIWNGLIFLHVICSSKEELSVELEECERIKDDGIAIKMSYLR
jgi:hypothetical protein